MLCTNLGRSEPGHDEARIGIPAGEFGLGDDATAAARLTYAKGMVCDIPPTRQVRRTLLRMGRDQGS